MDEIQTVGAADVERAVSVLITAFSSDPFMRWVWPEPHEYLRHFPELVHAFGGGAVEHRSGQVTRDFQGASLWLPPGVTPDDAALGALIMETVPERQRAGMFSLAEQITAAHPHEPHWHLTFIGVDPLRRGKGTGASLLRHALARIDALHQHCYLESTNPANLSLYERHGFEVVNELRAADSPPLFPMVRTPRPQA
jgi:ribosomal protein S18 acetylase RimI-like enzyme